MNNIKKYRGQKGVSQGDLADKIGIKRQYINSIEQGKIVPSFPTVKRIAEELGVSYLDLYGGEIINVVFGTDNRKADIIELLFDCIEDEKEKALLLERLRKTYGKV